MTDTRLGLPEPPEELDNAGLGDDYFRAIVAQFRTVMPVVIRGTMAQKLATDPGDPRRMFIVPAAGTEPAYVFIDNVSDWLQIYPAPAVVIPDIPTPVVPSYKAGDLLTQPLAGGTLAGGTYVGQMTFVRVLIPRNYTVDRIGLAVTSATASGCSHRLGIYTDVAGRPGARVLDAGVIATTSAGEKYATISQALAAGYYWLAVQLEANTGPIAAISSVSNVLIPDYPRVGIPISGAGYVNGFQVARAAGAFPSVAGTGIPVTTAPVLALRIA